MPFAVENLRVYQKSIDFADDVLAITTCFPRGFRFLADQLNRASVSIAANLAEGNGRFTKPDRKRFFGIARGSMLECLPLLDLAARRGLLHADQHATLRSNLEDISRMLSGLIRGLDNRAE
jgi:four helix bundle protein